MSSPLAYGLAVRSDPGKDVWYIKDQDRVPYRILIWATANKQVPLAGKIGVKMASRGSEHITTDWQFHVMTGKASSPDELYGSIFAIRDAGDIKRAPLPIPVDLACQKAKYLGNKFNPIEETKFTARCIDEHEGVAAGKGASGPGSTGDRA